MRIVENFGEIFVYIRLKRSLFWDIELWPDPNTRYKVGSIETSPIFLSAKLSEIYAFEVDLLKNKVLRKMALKILQLSDSNMNKLIMVMRWVHISLHRTETECRIELWVATCERGWFNCKNNIDHGECWHIIMRWKEKVPFTAKCFKKYWFYRKMLQIKVEQDSISYKNLNERISLSTPGVELGSSKDLHSWKIITHWHEKVHLRAECCKKYRLYRKVQ